MKSVRLSKFAVHLAVIVGCLALALPAWAWKPKTHIYLADLALRDVEAHGGKVVVYSVNHDTGARLGKVGEYQADGTLLAAIRDHRKIFNAGVLGPDAYPDIVTGQCIIHPENSLDEGSNSWLEHLWNQSRNSGPKVKAFVAGYLFHAAGDMYAHTYMNNFAGGDFKIGTNALRHLVLEGYLGKLTPFIADKQFSIRESANDFTVRDWIYSNLIRADIGSTLENKLLVAAEAGGPGAELSVPRVFSRLRNHLVQEKAVLSLARESGRPLSVVKRAYIEAWIDDIDDGLKAWPLLSERIAGLLVYNLNESMSTSDIKEGVADQCNNYLNQHLLSMAGLPDFVGMSRAQVQAFVDPIVEPFSEQIDALKSNLANAIIKGATGYTLDELADKINRPEVYFNPVLGPGSPRDAGAATITKAAVDADLQILKGGQWNLESFPPAYNTVLMTKLALLPKLEMDRLIKDLRLANLAVPLEILNRGGNLVKPGPLSRVSKVFTQDNAMLGFNLKLDGSNQWRLNGSPLQMALVRAGVYNKVFLKQVGEKYEPVLTPSKPPSSGTIRVTVTRVKSIDDIDPVPGQGNADFYGRIEIDDKFKAYATIDNDSDISPNWQLSNPFVGEVATIRIRLFEEDVVGDDTCDINPKSDRKRLRVFLNLKTGRVTGDATGNQGQVITVRGAGDGDRCEISFKIELL